MDKRPSSWHKWVLVPPRLCFLLTYRQEIECLPFTIVPPMEERHWISTVKWWCHSPTVLGGSRQEQLCTFQNSCTLRRQEGTAIYATQQIVVGIQRSRQSGLVGRRLELTLIMVTACGGQLTTAQM